jgi:RimJ/RimL family protein N-acetyltransferase
MHSEIRLVDDRVRLRPYAQSDVAALVEAARESVAEAYPWLPWCHPSYGVEDALDWIGAREDQWALDRDYSFVVEDVVTARFLGGVGLNQIDRLHRRANLGYWTRTSACGRGIATRATRLAARFGFAELGLVRLEILASVDNRASQRVAERAGAVREGVLRSRLVMHGRVQDAIVFSLVPADL